MISSSTGYEGMEMSKSLLARADASFTCSWDTVADAVVVLSRIVVQDAIAGVGTCVLVTRCLCTLSLIFCSNERGVHIGLCGKVGRGLVSGRRFIGRGVRSDSDSFWKLWFNTLFSYCWVGPFEPPIIAFTSAGIVVSLRKW